MDDPRWLRIIIVGLVLAALATIYYLLTGAFTLNKAAKQAIVPKTIVQASPSPVTNPSTPKPTSLPAPQSAYDRIAARNQGSVSVLPKTGFPIGLAALLFTSVMIIGVGLRKYPD